MPLITSYQLKKNMKFDLKKILLKGLPVIIGGAAGFAYYYFIGCNSGTCPIQSNPYISTLYGMAAGAIFLFPSKKKTETKM